ncbi:MAG: caspase family protein [Cyanobacteria bacterium P01_D01_bin.128]
MGLNRRAFLQQSGLLLGTLGLSEAGLLGLTGRYQQALAQPARRKLALLVGIDQYPTGVCAPGIADQQVGLKGATTDVRLQRQLLTGRFGFQSEDILTLTNADATREGITRAFLTHLCDQAEPGDAVVFHFSGYGSQIELTSDSKNSSKNNLDGDLQNDPNQSARSPRLTTSLVPVDGLFPNADNAEINDLPLDTLRLLIQALRTNRVTTILDCGTVELGQLTWGNLKLRSRPQRPKGRLNADSVAFQTELIERIKSIKGRRTQPLTTLQSESFPGVLLQAASDEQPVVEGVWQDFNAGVFTHTLTQQLWNLIPPATLRFAMGRATETVRLTSGLAQRPQIAGKRQGEEPLFPYDIQLTAESAADGLITAAEDDRRYMLWLGGLPAGVLEHYRSQSLLQVEATNLGRSGSASSNGSGGKGSSDDLILKLQSRSGLMAEASVQSGDTGALQVGQRVREISRLLPDDLDLVVAIDSSLERIERVDATSALSGLNSVASVVAGEQAADCVFGRIGNGTTTLPTDLRPLSASSEPEDLPALGYGLFSPSRELIPGTVAKEEEAIKTAINRLAPQLQVLLSAKRLRMTLNQSSSQLAVRASLELTEPQERLVMQQETVRSPQTLPVSRLASIITNGERPTEIPAGGRIRYRLANFGDRPLYYTLISFDGRGRALALYPNTVSDDSGDDQMIKAVARSSSIDPGDIQVIPKTGIDWIADASSSWVETHLVFSIQPLYQTFNTLWQAMKTSGSAGRVNMVSQPLRLAQAILSDLQQASLSIKSEEKPQDGYRLNVQAWANLNFVYGIAHTPD